MLRREVADASSGLARPVTASFGVALYRQGESWEALVDRADLALYRAKEGGRNRVALETGSEEVRP